MKIRKSLFLSSVLCSILLPFSDNTTYVVHGIDSIPGVYDSSDEEDIGYILDLDALLSYNTAIYSEKDLEYRIRSMIDIVRADPYPNGFYTLEQQDKAKEMLDVLLKIKFILSTAKITFAESGVENKKLLYQHFKDITFASCYGPNLISNFNITFINQ